MMTQPGRSDTFRALRDVPSAPSEAAPLRAGVAPPANAGAEFTHFHERYAPGVLFFFLKRTARARELSQELAQRTWLHVWQAFQNGRFDPSRAALSTFTYAVATNVWRQHCQNARSSPADSSKLDDVADHAGLTSDSLAHAELLAALRDCIRAEAEPWSLSDEERLLVIGLSEGLSERALAASLNVAPSTINAKKRAALAKLRAALMLRGFTQEIVEQAGLPLE